MLYNIFYFFFLLDVNIIFAFKHKDMDNYYSITVFAIGFPLILGIVMATIFKYSDVKDLWKNGLYPILLIIGIILICCGYLLN